MTDEERRLSIERLKQNWHRDPNWYLEDTPGFEDVREELQEYSDKCNAEWADKRGRHHAELAAKLCPKKFNAPINARGVCGIFTTYTCDVEKCAWWRDDVERCGAIFPIATSFAV